MTNIEQMASEALQILQKKLLCLVQAIERSGLDISPCMRCGEPVVCIPDGLPMCKACATADWQRAVGGKP